MLDAERENPVCGDSYAKVFMSEEGIRIFEPFKEEVNPNAGNVARHRVIDDLLREELSTNPDLQIVIIGAGFDSRAYRLPGGIWIELDEPQIIQYKNQRLMVSDCKNQLQRIPIDFSNDSLADKLAPYSGSQHVIVVIEGVFMYLSTTQITQLLKTLQQLFPVHRLFCDLMKRSFFVKYSRPIHEKIVGLGATFKDIVDNPKEVFLENGYRHIETISIVEKVSEFGPVKIPKLMLKYFLRTLHKGYCIVAFETQ